MTWDPSIGVVRTLDLLSSEDGRVMLIRKERKTWALVIAEPTSIDIFEGGTLSEVLSKAVQHKESKDHE